eukprot:TRINITY_DN15844_c0_g1_i1.p1 TRINITY_DN15844_c0_g1~~TRINITY_DN15844_c0_g1_i1.p1  ORF type:complete len:359 (+),score=69.21 TRINITY_DN15844_c0_g1_i1:389-1465(+)
MEYFPEGHRVELSKAQWVVLGRCSGVERMGSGSKTESSLVGVEEEEGVNRYYAKYWCGEGSYSVVVVDEVFNRVWVCNEDEGSVERTAQSKLRHLNIGFHAITNVVRDSLEKSCKVLNANPPHVTLLIESTLKLAGTSTSVPLSWAIEATLLPPTEAIKVVSQLLVQPLLGVVSALSYSKSLFHQTVLAKDRELKSYRDAFGPLPNQARLSPVFNPDTYYPELLKSSALLSCLRPTPPFPLGGVIPTQLPQHNTAPVLYELFFSHPEKDPVKPSPPKENRLALDPQTPPDCFLGGDADEDLPPLDLSPPSKRARVESYIETEEETKRREELTQKLKTSPEKKGKEKAVMKKKLKKVFK